MMKEGFNSTGTAPLKVTAEKKMNTQLKQNVMQQKRFTVWPTENTPPPHTIFIHWCKLLQASDVEV